MKFKLYIRVRSSSGKTPLKLTEKYFPSEVSKIPEEKYVTLCLYLSKEKKHRKQVHINNVNLYIHHNARYIKRQKFSK